MKALIRTLALIAMICASAIAQSATSTDSTASISGRVTIGGNPAPGVSVTLLPHSSDPQRAFQTALTGRPALRATTDEEGRYRLANIAPGLYTVMTYAPSLISSGNKPVTVGEGESIEGVDFALTRGGVITGRVTSQGRPAIGVSIDLYLISDAGHKSPWMPNDEFFRTDDRGVYRVFGLPAGRYIVGAGRNPGDLVKVFFRKRTITPTYHPDVTDEAKAAIIEVKEGGEVTGVDIKLAGAERGFKVSGRVIDAETGKPVANALPFFTAASHTANPARDSGAGAASNSKGEFFFEGVSPGVYMATVRFLPEGESEYYSEPVSFEVKGEDVRGLEIKVRHGGSISGVVVVEGGNDPPSLAETSGARLWAMVRGTGADQGGGYGSSAIAADGSFSIRGLPGGEAQIRFFDPLNAAKFSLLRVERGGLDVRDGLEIAAGEQVSGVVVVLAQSRGVVRGRVAVQGGALPRTAHVVVMLNRIGEEDLDEPLMRDVGPDLRFQFDHVAAGDYEIEVFTEYDAPGSTGSLKRSAKQKLSVSNDSVSEVTLVLDLSAKGKQKDKDDQ